MDAHSVVVRKKDPLSSSVGDEVVILSAKKGLYYGTEAVGSRIWSLIEQPTSVVRLCNQVMKEFEVDQATCERDVLSFLEQLEGEDLIIVH
ncbi:hypothetical protein GCM10007160_04680 [Litchfieldella qijiaojingensis]|uniref:PqqD family protein n=1 Tax=Litchfieldella qijiaojingensis TaxID=980347 RepID=A0ABQ2YDN6_9GAMM|nr:lasso peptide biosynthesis PqqD family chaperone [Halomonas qijiaojingensis]GGX80243.1 hypothetical protein GCM10007160_04680 [Halomonas qijiaojingensis]